MGGHEDKADPIPGRERSVQPQGSDDHGTGRLSHAQKAPLHRAHERHAVEEQPESSKGTKNAHATDKSEPACSVHVGNETAGGAEKVGENRARSAEGDRRGGEQRNDHLSDEPHENGDNTANGPIPQAMMVGRSHRP